MGVLLRRDENQCLRCGSFTLYTTAWPGWTFPPGPPGIPGPVRSGWSADATSDGEPHDLRIVVGVLVIELGVGVHDVVVESLVLVAVRNACERLAEQDLVEHLAVALEDVGVALLLRQGAWQVNDGVGAGPDHDVDGRAELEVVDVTEHDDVCGRVSSEEQVEERADLLSLQVTCLLRVAQRLLPLAEERVV